MKQVIQSYKTGKLQVIEVPAPQVRPSGVLVRTLYSAISAGTEKTKVDTAKMSLIQKAKSRPDLVKKVLQKMKTEGVWSTYQMVQNRLAEPVPLGYSLVGVVEEVGEWVEGIQVGDIVACAGAGYANHAEYNVVPGRLAVKCSPETPLDQAAFTTIGSIALQGIRQTDPKLGEKIIVLGMGLIGQITGHLLQANGCEVLAMDLDSWKLEQARAARAANLTALPSDPDLQQKVMEWTHGRGADAVILTASTSSDAPIEQAGLLCRDKGRVVIVGAVGTKFPREPFYMKEIDIRIARSYGPGRYDPLYEEMGIDYPVGFVRFTEQRNMEAFVDLLATKRLDLSRLVTHRFPIERAKEAFEMLSAGSTPYLGILLEYQTPPNSARAQAPVASKAVAQSSATGGDIGFIGLGNYATAQLLPALKGIDGVRLREVATGSGMSAAVKSKQYGFETTLASPSELIASPKNKTVFVVTRHDTHARYVCEALKAGKNVFVEKPLCLTPDELPEIQRAYFESNAILCVGFNRRFSPLVTEAKRIFPSGASHILYRVNAGPLNKEHWLKMPEVGGGRIIGEGCHFIDLASDFARSPIRTVFARAIGRGGAPNVAETEDVHISLGFENGSVATILYMASGHSKLAKEYIELHGGGRSLLIKDFTSLEIPGAPEQKLKAQDKGQKEMVRLFTAACRIGDRTRSPIPAEQIWNSTAATFAVAESLRTGTQVRLLAEKESMH